METKNVIYAEMNTALVLVICFEAGTAEVEEIHTAYVTGTTFRALNGFEMRCKLPPSMWAHDLEGLREEIAGQLAELRELADGSRWDGSNQVQDWTDAERAATVRSELHDTVEKWRNDLGNCPVWEIDEYLAPVVSREPGQVRIESGWVRSGAVRIYPGTSFATLERYARRLQTAVDGVDEVVMGDPLKWLENLRDTIRA